MTGMPRTWVGGSKQSVTDQKEHEDAACKMVGSPPPCVRPLRLAVRDRPVVEPFRRRTSRAAWVFTTDAVRDSGSSPRAGSSRVRSWSRSKARVYSRVRGAAGRRPPGRRQRERFISCACGAIVGDTPRAAISRGSSARVRRDRRVLRAPRLFSGRLARVPVLSGCNIRVPGRRCATGASCASTRPSRYGPHPSFCHQSNRGRDRAEVPKAAGLPPRERPERLLNEPRPSQPLVPPGAAADRGRAARLVRPP